MECWLTLLRIHFFNVVLIILRIVLVLSELASHVVHYRWRSRGHSPLFAGYVFAFFRVECRLFVGRDYTVGSVITVVRVRLRSGHRSSQFDKVLTRDAPNVCNFLHPLREGIARETYIGLSIRFGPLLFHKLFTGHLEFHYFFEADTELFMIENKQNGRIFLYGTYSHTIFVQFLLSSPDSCHFDLGNRRHSIINLITITTSRWHYEFN